MQEENVLAVEKVESPVALGSAHIKATPYAIEFEGSPSIEEWYNAVQSVQKVHGMCQFYLGDLVVYAESPVTGWGESKYQELMDATGYEYMTLAQFSRVARRFDKDFREEVLKDLYAHTNVSNLGFQHWQVVASLEDEQAKYFLEMCRDGGWSVAKLREEITLYKNGGKFPEPKEPMELPDGWESIKDAPKTFYGYVPAPKVVGGESTSQMLEIHDWELEILQELCEKDGRLLSFLERIELALGE